MTLTLEQAAIGGSHWQWATIVIRKLSYPLLLVMTACATPYGKKDASSLVGYTDELVEPGKYLIKVNGKEFDSEETMLAYWHRRASELCTEEGYLGEPITGQLRKIQLVYVHNVGLVPSPTYYPYAEGVAECQKLLDINEYATPYQKKDRWSKYGYTDELLEEKKYRLRIDGGPYDTDETVVKYWHRRAKELCDSIDYTGAPLSGRVTATEAGRYQSDGVSAKTSRPYVEGIVECEQ